MVTNDSVTYTLSMQFWQGIMLTRQEEECPGTRIPIWKSAY